MNKNLTLIPVGGLANRMRTINSVIEFCKADNRDLSVIWFLDKGLNCSFYDLFEPIEVDGLNIQLRDNSFTDLWIYDRPRLKNLYIPAISEAFLFKKRIYEKKSIKMFIDGKSLNNVQHYNNIYLASYVGDYPLSDNYSYFKPIPLLEKRIESISKKFNKYTIGIHIRRTDHSRSIHKSPTELFIEKMNEELHKNGETNFYLASDSIEEKQKLKNIFGNKLITIFDETRRDTKAGIQDSLVDLYTLSHTSKIYGSFLSSFSQTAGLISNIEFTELQIKT